MTGGKNWENIVLGTTTSYLLPTLYMSTEILLPIQESVHFIQLTDEFKL